MRWRARIREARTGACLAAALAALGSAAACAGGAGRDVVPESHDVRAATGSGGAGAGPATAPSPDGYVYVARRALGVVALAEARGLADDVARRAIDHLADALDACATDLGRQGKLAAGALRVVAQIGADGTVSGLNVKVAPEATANAILCLVAPLKLTSFPAAEGDAGARGIAIEATWGSVRAP